MDFIQIKIEKDCSIAKYIRIIRKFADWNDKAANR